jgi:ABC-type transport system substrate-binding protein
LLIGKAKEKLRLNYREAWFLNLDEITTNGDREVAFHLKRPQPAFISLLASGYSPIYPCHVSARDMRTHPVGTGPFKFVEYKPNQSIKVARNPDYWKPGRPYLDGIEYTIIPNRSTAILAFVAGKFDMTAFASFWRASAPCCGGRRPVARRFSGIQSEAGTGSVAGSSTAVTGVSTIRTEAKSH